MLLGKKNKSLQKQRVCLYFFVDAVNLFVLKMTSMVPIVNQTTNLNLKG